MARLALILMLLALLALALAAAMQGAARLAEATAASRGTPNREKDAMPKGLSKIAYPLLIVMLFMAVAGGL